VVEKHARRLPVSAVVDQDTAHYAVVVVVVVVVVEENLVDAEDSAVVVVVAAVVAGGQELDMELEVVVDEVEVLVLVR
jgi:hypothetical protein